MKKLNKKLFLQTRQPQLLFDYWVTFQNDFPDIVFQTMEAVKIQILDDYNRTLETNIFLNSIYDLNNFLKERDSYQAYIISATYFNSAIKDSLKNDLDRLDQKIQKYIVPQNIDLLIAKLPKGFSIKELNIEYLPSEFWWRRCY